ncbi:MAG: hypothetical protein J7K59_00640 [Candidatus Korarchaeota archaeon]|nr:hypothetical protein [Candidatus Korarchaeota archaeon]
MESNESKPNYSPIFEFKIMLLRPKPEKGHEKEWVLKSFGATKDMIKVYNYIEKKDAVTPEDIAQEFNKSIEESIEILDQLYNLGIVEKLGRGYLIEYPLHIALRRKTLKMLEKILLEISDIAKRAEKIKVRSNE